MDEKFLVKKAKKGDAKSFGLLYEGVYKKLYKFALYTLKNPNDAEDVVSETVMDAYASIGKLKNEEAFSSWIFQILSNKCKHKMRDYYRQRNELSLNSSGVEGDWGDEDSDILERNDLSTDTAIEEQVINNVQLRNCFSQLDDVERMIIAMHVISGYKTREIAEILELNENTVRSKESRGLKKMAAILGRGER